ncbi:MAG: hypothetical protein RL173_2492 [Fibrobacterota bacterium]|jgi:hypothetical protein
MNVSRATNPEIGGSLLDRSSAKPGSVDMSIFEKKQKVGQGTTSSNYLKKTREEDPWPEKKSESTTTIELSQCQILTPPNKMDIGRDFEAQCNAAMVNNCTPSNMKVKFEFRCKTTVDGEAKDDVVSDPIVGYLDLDSKNQVVKIKGKLPKPPSHPANDSKVTYILTATHPEAKDKAESAPVEVIIHYPADDASDSEHVGERTVSITTKDGTPLVGAEYVLCGDGKKLKSGRLDEDAQMTYQAKAGVKYSIYMVNAGPIIIDDAGDENE